MIPTCRGYAEFGDTFAWTRGSRLKAGADVTRVSLTGTRTDGMGVHGERGKPGHRVRWRAIYRQPHWKGRAVSVSQIIRPSFAS